MLLFLCSIIVATAAGVTAFLILVSGDSKKFRQSFSEQHRQKDKQLPIVTRDGQIIDTKEELEAQLEVLQYNLEKKRSELDSSRSRVFETANNLQKLKNTSTEIKRYYLRMASEVQRYEKDCQVLQQEIDDYKKRKFELDTCTESFEDMINLDIDSSLPPSSDIESTRPAKTQSLP